MCSYLWRYFKIDKVDREENLILREEIIPLIQFSHAINQNLGRFPSLNAADSKETSTLTSISKFKD
jgi:hypothetical protein